MFVPRSVIVPYSLKQFKEQQTTSKTTKEDDGHTTVEKPVTVVDHRHKPVQEKKEEFESKVEDEEELVMKSLDQRWPNFDEPVCIVCGRYGAYIIDETDEDVCSVECKMIRLKKTSTASWDESVDRPTSTNRKESSLSEHQVDLWRREMNVAVKGTEAPPPVLTVNQLHLDLNLQENLVKKGYTQFTPVQMQVIPAVLKDRDLLVSSATGSGKSLSYLLPIVHKLSSPALLPSLPFSSPSSPLALILCPTRELCIQLEDQCKQLMRGLPDMKTALVIGGLPLSQQLHRFKSRIQLIVGTPARVKDIILNHSDSVSLKMLKVLVLDEVDSLLQMGFEEQVQCILDHIPSSRQTLMFSATIPPVIEQFATKLLRNPLVITVAKPGTLTSGIKHTVVWAEEEEKKKRLFSFLTDKDLFCPPAIVFVNSKKGTLLLADTINKVCDVAAVCLHGDMVQEKRTAILHGFQEGKYEVVVSTGILGRGLALPSVHQVFNFDIPSKIEEFVHQVGRAERLGSYGWAISFINNMNKGVFLDLVNLLEPLSVSLPPQLVHSPYLAQQRRKHKRKLEEADEGESSKRSCFKYSNQATLLDLIKERQWKKQK